MIKEEYKAAIYVGPVYIYIYIYIVMFVRNLSADKVFVNSIQKTVIQKSPNGCASQVANQY